MRLRDFKVLTFDCYGTLIDWETGIFEALAPWLAGAGLDLGRDVLLEKFAAHESAQQAATPAMRYPELLAAVQNSLAKELGIAATAAETARFGASVKDWPAFPDSAAALSYLKGFYKLVILSNIDRQSFQASNAKLGVTFDQIHTAEDIGSYKPDPRNFEYLLARLAEANIAKSDVLHTAQSLFHDHRPALDFGLATNWIDRRHGQQGAGATMAIGPTGPSGPDLPVDFHHTSMADFVDRHKAEIGG